MRNEIAAGLLTACVVFALAPPVTGQAIAWTQRDAVAWLRSQTVTGEVDGAISTGVVMVNGEAFDFDVTGSAFTVEVLLGEGENVIVACTNDLSVCSDTLRRHLGYELRPEVFAHADVSGRTIRLLGRTIENPTGTEFAFRWKADPDNPVSTSISSPHDSAATTTIPPSSPPGEYFFDLLVTDEDGNEGRARTFVTVDSSGDVTPFDIEHDHARWVDEAVIFAITPYIFEERGGLANVLNRLEEVARLGVNTIWLQPIFQTHAGGQGYDVTNYFEVRSDYGTKEDLRLLVDRAHELGLKVLLDFVPNHTAAEHPYAQDAAEHGTLSHYYAFYLTEEDDAPYAMHYRPRPMGQVQFLRYFWENLLLIDHDNPEVQRWMIEAGRYWIEEFDVDGYRIDAVWGTNARTPEMMQDWRRALKRYKPEVLLLGEDKATEPHSFEGRFDIAYDWYPGQIWVSRWTWQLDFSETDNRTIFNAAPELQRSNLLHDALTNRGDGWHSDAKVLRFMENNDTFRFVEHHSLEQTKMVAALLFSLPGVPLIYNGQEIGRSGHPYSSWYVYFQGTPIEDQSRFGLYPFYVRLIEIRARLAALTSDHFEEVDTSPSSVYSYRRWLGDQNVFGVINPTSNSVTATLSLSEGELGVDANTTYYLTDQVSGDVFEVGGADVSAVAIEMPATSTRILVFADQVVHVDAEADPSDDLPQRVTLEQNYPNPFNPSTAIRFTLPHSGNTTLRVFDVLGREVARLVDQVMPAGRHEVRFEAGDLASGVYVYRLDVDGLVATKELLLVR